MLLAPDQPPTDVGTNGGRLESERKFGKFPTQCHRYAASLSFAILNADEMKCRAKAMETKGASCERRRIGIKPRYRGMCCSTPTSWVEDVRRRECFEETPQNRNAVRQEHRELNIFNSSCCFLSLLRKGADSTRQKPGQRGRGVSASYLDVHKALEGDGAAAVSHQSLQLGELIVY